MTTCPIGSSRCANRRLRGRSRRRLRSERESSISPHTSCCPRQAHIKSPMPGSRRRGGPAAPPQAWPPRGDRVMPASRGPRVRSRRSPSGRDRGDARRCVRRSSVTRRSRCPISFVANPRRRRHPAARPRPSVAHRRLTSPRSSTPSAVAVLCDLLVADACTLDTAAALRRPRDDVAARADRVSGVDRHRPTGRLVAAHCRAHTRADRADRPDAGRPVAGRSPARSYESAHWLCETLAAR